MKSGVNCRKWRMNWDCHSMTAVFAMNGHNVATVGTNVFQMS